MECESQTKNQEPMSDRQGLAGHSVFCPLFSHKFNI